MTRTGSLSLCIAIASLATLTTAARADTAKYVEEYKDPVTEQMKERLAKEKAKDEAITKEIRDRQREQKEARNRVPRVLQMDVSGIQKPASPEAFTSAFHFPPVSQDRTGGCWCFTGISYIESEVHRLTGKDVRLSEMYVIYYEYLEKARRFVRERGDSVVSLGSEVNAGPRMMKTYGVVPLEAYPGKIGTDRYEHHPMVAELQAYLDLVKKNDLWDENEVLAVVRIILNKYLGEPPATFEYEGKTVTPKDFLTQALKIDPDQYVVAMSTLSKPFYVRAELDVSDNWWRSADYYNLPLDEWYGVIQGAITKGYTVGLCGDVSEPGYVGEEDVAVVPDFDIPADRINQEARELRIVNGATADDHCVHLVGSLRLGDHDWFLIKDSSRTVHPGKFPGYHFYRDDYVRLKMMSFLVHKDAMRDLLKKFR